MEAMDIEQLIETDVLVVGGTVAGCSAAISAARMGARVVILEPTSSVGGTTTNGVHCFDTGTVQALSGVTEEFINRVRAHYRDIGLDDPMLRSKSDVFWEFHVAERMWRDMLGEHERITLINGAVAVGVKMRGNREIAEVHWEQAIDPIGSLADEPPGPANVIRPLQVIDASYEGDVTAWAGVPFDIGREARTPEEPHAGVIFTTTHERDITEGGFLPGSILPGSTGEGDDAIISFTCRMSLRYRHEGFEDFLLGSPPEDYDPARYKWAPPKGLIEGGGAFGTSLQPSIRGKMLTNQRYFGDDRLEGNRDYILSHPRQRTAIRKSFMNHALGFLHYIQTDGGMPQMGLSDDEFVENANMPRSPYVREGRRFHAPVRLKERDVTAYLASPGPRPPLRPDSIAIGDWAVESRRCKDEPDPETGVFDGSMFIRTLRAPYQVPMGCLLPEGVDNLSVTTTISATHIAFCTLRVEAVWAQTGAAAGCAAGIAVAGKLALADVPLGRIQSELLAQRYKLVYFSDVESDHPSFAGIQWLALRGYLPEMDARFRFFPENTATWRDFVQAAVLAFGLPISVTGIHFDTVDPSDPAFRSVETLYDTASRAGVALFPNMRHPSIDAPADHLLPEPRQRWLTLALEEPVSGGEAIGFLQKLRRAIGSDETVEPPDGLPEKTALTRAELAELLHIFAAPPDAGPF